MGSQGSFFEALRGETPIGFFTHSTTLSHGDGLLTSSVI